MKKLDFGQTITVLANLGVIAGIVFLALEIRASTRATQAASIQTASALDQEHLLLIGASSEQTELWETYLSFPDNLSEIERTRGHYLLAALIRRLENVYLLNQMGALSEDSWRSRQYLLMVVARSRGFAAFIDSPIALSANQDFLAYMEATALP